MKIKHPLVLTACLAAGLSLALPPAAKAQMCDTPYETISTVKLPTYGFPTVWDADYGADNKMVQFAAGIQMDQGTVLVYVRKLEESTNKPLETGLVELNRRGRTLVEQFYPAKEGEEPVALVRLGDKADRFVGVSNFRSGKGNIFKHVRLSWYDRQGVYKKDLQISDPAYDYQAESMIKAPDGDGFTTVIHAVSRKDPTDQYGVLIRYTAEGKQVWKRAYRPGVNNALHGLAVTDDKAYLATGKIIMDDGRMAGWILKLGYDGTILWQRTYPRGKFSELRAGAMSPRKTGDKTSFFLVSGSAEPSDNKPNAAWVMEVDPRGEPSWQRYYRRADFAMDGRAVMSYPDGRIVSVINARKVTDDKNNSDHIRIMTLSPRGNVINDESYLNGLAAYAVQADKSRTSEDIVVVGTVLKEQKEDTAQFGPAKPVPEGMPPLKEPPLQEGWVMVTPGLDSYTDPCIRRAWQ